METVISRWGENGPRPEPLAANDALFGAFEASGSVEVACTPHAAWNLVTDIGRIGEFSPECIGARWIDEVSGPSEGARFEGTNRIVDEAGDTEVIWIRPCTVTVLQPPQHFSCLVGDRYDGTPAMVWDFEITAAATGCRITQRFRHLPKGLSGIRLAADREPARAETIVRDRIGELTGGIEQTLAAMKRALESTPSENES